jgi:Putative prokaryotic signal transducing protein
MLACGHSDLVVVQSFGTRVEADIAQGILESSGIDAMIQADTAGGMRQHLAWSGLGFRVLVCEEDVAMARDVLKPPPDTDDVVVQTFATQDEADCAQGALLSAGIAATIQDDSAGGWRPDVPWTGSGFRVLVPADDVATARHVLDRPDETHAKA